MSPADGHIQPDLHADALRRALQALTRMQERLEAVMAATTAPIAIIGLGCRFPGADGPAAFHSMLIQGRDIIGPVPAVRGFGDVAAPQDQGGFFADIAGFDPVAFGLDDATSLAMDPHQRLLLEVADQAIADAGLSRDRLAGSRTGVWLGLGAQNGDYVHWLMQVADNLPPAVAAHIIDGGFHSLMPGRLSYHYDLRGPSLVVDAACASGLVAVAQACDALRRGDCDLGLAAAVNLVLSPLVGQAVTRAGLWSKRGRCRPFDADADGFVRGEGAGLLVLKRLSDALRDGDAIRAVIRGTSVGQDGHSNGLTAPNGPAQEAIIRSALDQAGVAGHQVGYVEAHATGTRLGDAIEGQALAAALGGDRQQPLLIGGVKGNLGHLEAASGMAGLIKAVLALYHREIPPTRNHAALNPDLVAESGMLRVVTSPTSWPDAAPLAGVSAMGMSGTNAHILLGPCPADAPVRPLVTPRLFNRRLLWPAGIGPDGQARPVPSPPQSVPDGMLTHLVWRPMAALTPKTAPTGPVTLFRAQAGMAPAFVIDGFISSLRAALADGSRLLILVDGAGVAARMALALGRVAALEHPELHVRRVQFDGPEPDLQAALSMDEEWLRHGTDGWTAPRLVPMPMPVPATRPFRVRANACYLITGGHGGIGRDIARWLVDAGAKDLLLLGRRATDDAQLAGWRAAGVRVRVTVGDVADAGAIAAALAGLDREGVALAGLFHTAGVTADALLTWTHPETLGPLLRAKIDGALLLDAMTRGRGLDAFVLFSSITALTGLVGTGAYAAANAALGAVAAARRAAGEAALAVHWGTWDGSGMARAAGGDLAARWADHGLTPFPAADGTAALSALLSTSVTEAVAARVDWSRMVAADLDLAGLCSELVTKAPDPGHGLLQNISDLDGIVRASVAHLLGLSTDDPALDRPFGELGLGSLAAVDLRNRLSQALGIAVPVTLAFNHPSIAAIVRHLHPKLASASALTKPVADLTEDEAEARLARLLAELEPGGTD